MPDRRTAASVVFCGTFFFGSISVGGESFALQLQYIELLALAFLALPLVAQRGRAAGRVLKVGWASALVALPAQILYGATANAGPPSVYLRQTIIYFVYVLIVATYAAFFFDSQTFVKAFWRVGMTGLILALAGYALHRLTGLGYFVSVAQYGGAFSSAGGAPRLTGMLTEPSAWAPVMPALAFLALQRKAWLALAGVVLGTVLTGSPTVILGMFAAVVLVLFTGRGNLALKSIVVVSAVALSYVAVGASQDRTAYTAIAASGNTSKIAVGRTLSGLDYILTGGEYGSNDRAASTEMVAREVSANGWLYTGRGLGAADVYFPAIASQQGFGRPNALPVVVLFDLGVLGLLAYLLLVGRAVRAVSRDVAGVVLIPFLVATFINSAGGIATYKFVLLAVLVHAFRGGRQKTTWSMPSRTRRC